MINTTGKKIPLQCVEVSVQYLWVPCAHGRTAISTEAVTALFRLRDRTHEDGRCLEGNLFTSQIFHSGKWLDKHEGLKMQQLRQPLQEINTQARPYGAHRGNGL